VQIADDEYTYDLSRFALISAARIFFDLDIGGDFSIEHRQYGATLNRKGETIEGSGRIEDGRYFNLSLSKIFVFEDRLGGLFTSVIPSLQLQNANVTADQAGYTYNATNVAGSITLGF
jgi:hypothetical protein